MTDKVVPFPRDTKAPLDPDQVLEAAKGELMYVLVVGYTKEGEFYRASSTSDEERAVFVLEKAKFEFLFEDGENE